MGETAVILVEKGNRICGTPIFSWVTSLTNSPIFNLVDNFPPEKKQQEKKNGTGSRQESSNLLCKVVKLCGKRREKKTNEQNTNNSTDFNLITPRISFSCCLVFFLQTIRSSELCVSNILAIKRRGGEHSEKRNSVLSFFVLLFSYLATPDDHSETTSMASTGRQEQRGEKALVPHARIRSPKQRETKRRRAR